jgi:hypothetical protein
MAALQREDDILVRQWLAIAAKRFSLLPELAMLLVAIVCDADDDVGVRHNALDAIRAARLPEHLRALLARHVADAEMGPTIRAWLAEGAE